MPRHPNAPDPTPLISDILGPNNGGPNLWQDLSKGTRDRAGGLKRGDLMRAGGWALRSPLVDGGGHQIFDAEGEPLFKANYDLSQSILSITTDDIREINQLLQKFNDRDYGTGVYFCCCCV